MRSTLSIDFTFHMRCASDFKTIASVVNLDMLKHRPESPNVLYATRLRRKTGTCEIIDYINSKHTIHKASACLMPLCLSPTLEKCRDTCTSGRNRVQEVSYCCYREHS